MCTVALAFQRYPGLPLLLAANRDEKLDRPAEPLALREHQGHAVLTPLDRLAGGTWLGLSRHQVLVAVTNRFGFTRDPARRSRGLIVLDALTAPTAAEAAGAVAALPPEATNPFHLFIADRQRGFLLVHDGAAIRTSELAPGWHVLTERSEMGAPPLRELKVRRALAAMEAVPQREALKDLLSSHQDAPLDATCVHLPDLDYGTRATTLYFGAESRAERRLYSAEGPACQSQLVDQSALLEALGSARS
ncbi:MAG: NRDE family protein [Myxococcota bacterium]